MRRCVRDGPVAPPRRSSRLAIRSNRAVVTSTASSKRTAFPSKAAVTASPQQKRINSRSMPLRRVVVSSPARGFVIRPKNGTGRLVSASRYSIGTRCAVRSMLQCALYITQTSRGQYKSRLAGIGRPVFDRHMLCRSAAETSQGRCRLAGTQSAGAITHIIKLYVSTSRGRYRSAGYLIGIRCAVRPARPPEDQGRYWLAGIRSAINYL